MIRMKSIIHKWGHCRRVSSQTSEENVSTQWDRGSLEGLQLEISNVSDASNLVGKDQTHYIDSRMY